MKKINSILNNVLEKIKLTKEDSTRIEKSLGNFLEQIKKRINELKIDVEIFVGGSFAKKTVIKKDIYDIDIFLRFNKKYKEEISKITEKIIKNIGGFTIIHGSRDYFKIQIFSDFFIELIPVLKVKNPKQAENITDLSYAHVSYIKRRVKNPKLLDDIMLAKAFCYANHCYGAESYINGFSGYALELLIYYYKGFMKFIKAISKIDIKKKLVIDIEKLYKNKSTILIDINSAKLESPIILIDPTYKQRNALAALSDETLEKFKKSCKDFLSEPSEEAFELKKTDLEQIKKDAKSSKSEFILLEAHTNKQEGDIAGSKLLKFYKHFSEEIQNFFLIKDKGFNYNKKNAARFFFVVKNKGEILISGPCLKDEKNAKKFKKKHQTYFTKKNKLYSKNKIEDNINKFIDNWILKNKKKLKEMCVEKLEIIE
ncbi:MAG: nucleotidyltransferase domain-containing protein [Nanoarchaeota archaeon]|nr:nucleotidyltransferase domain-containing protein [Nanoarchaeota archaeon]MBU1027443.1 nucleotidyltransferase domain-containing protein [Nanoarchaeota archaeon]